MKSIRNYTWVSIIAILLSATAYGEQTENRLDLMPWPAKVELSAGEYRIDNNFEVEITGHGTGRLNRAAGRMLRKLSGSTGLFFSQDYISPDSVVRNPSMEIHVDRRGHLKLHEDESYELDVTPVRVLLTAKTDIGALRGIETLLQLLEADSAGYYFPAVKIVDYPRFPWRGLMIDASRHFMPMNVIKRNIDGMAAVKLNVLHWHLSDDQGFRAESRTYPKLTGMGSDGLFYTQAQIKEVIKYAADRGIRVVPEFDLPAHSTSWFVGYPNYASAPGPYSIERKFGIFNPVFNPTLKKTYSFLDAFFKEMCRLFPDHYMDIGGDENNGKQWNANPEIQQFMKTHRIPDDRSLQTYFENRLIPILTRYHKKAMGWEEILNPGLPKSAIIQSWRGAQSLEQAAQLGYRALLSKGFYLDHYMPASTYYLNDPLPDTTSLTDKQKRFIIGGEACMWSEFVSPENVDSRIWPRAAAIAERLWSPDSVRNVRDMYRRLKGVSLELESLGLTQIKNQAMMIRRLAAGRDPAPLTNLVNVVVPVELYARATTRHYTSYSPLTRVVDAAVPDPEVARNFAFMVDDLVSQASANP
ncbi:MAG: beta-hexosaminidase, partial [Ignavibacteriae bacterium 37-53-5]